MSYFGFLFRFLVIPILVLGGIALWDHRRGRQRLASLRRWPIWAAIGLHIIVALVYTTPWDNYLVATGVWWYDPSLVTGVTLGWVPIEEYTFFVLQPILAGLWLAFLARRLSAANELARSPLRVLFPLVVGLIWLGATAVLISGWQPGTYLALILVWALPPIVLQLLFGADILWRYRRLVLTAIVSLTLYLGTADTLAIGAGTWTIDPAQSLGIYLGRVLPLEEFVFFLLTNSLLIFGIVLIWADPAHERLALYRERLRNRTAKARQVIQKST